ncbi:hypothetical protein PR202_ga22078 [Eleusine coracana subsp. coracana]|uniref:Peptidase A1 domain-containing protein n=1 Tax=Eleusine coracana subsp. coracana TaxID=191504 RepID=A0AAV5D2Z8_ELECO|nr:hypothetical protein PR202_ga22078 [Eleusine coracana subsp. coracana]
MTASIFVLVMLSCAALASRAAGLRVGLKRIHSDNPRAPELGRKLASLDETLTASSRKDLRHGGEYVMTLSIGTPPTAYVAIIDTGSDTIMAQCAPCSNTSCTDPLYDPSSSKTFADLPCNSSLRLDACAAAAGGSTGCSQCTFNQTYTIGWAFVSMGVETLTFDQQASVPGVAFGCITDSSGGWEGSSGLVGMGRGNLSLVSQLGARKFSYCLTPFQDVNSTSTLLIGPSAAIVDGAGVVVQSTPFVPNPPSNPSYYYLNLTGISMGTTALSIPANAFALNPDDGTGGLIIDSGSTITSLVDVAYQQVRAEVLSLAALSPSSSHRTEMDLCFDLSSPSTPPAMPDMTFHFDGGADMVLPADNYISRKEY